MSNILKIKSDCLVCSLNKSAKFRVFSGVSWLVDRPMDINMNGLFFLKTKRHVENIDKLNIGEKKELGSLLSKFAAKSRRIAKAKRSITMCLGLKEPHVHFWIIPCVDSDKEEILGISKAISKLANKYRK